ncbi:MFS transporter [Pseudonocardia sp. NPDC049635]|uniref:MFS transporter n=1 Tax=Pseudonocardia sp. NPDC049635 TaxID=3155506 RepID=UPI0033E2D5CB
MDVATSRRAAWAGGVGTTVEYYDYSVYGFLAVVIAPQFFPSDSPTASVMAALLLFATGFVLRPVGGVIFGHIGDRYGRKTALIATLLMIGIASGGIGLVPTYDSIGVWAAVLLALLRCAQGLSAGGELGGSTVFIAESTGKGRKAAYGAATMIGISLGFSLAGAVAGMVSALLSPEDLAAWGWRIPFLLSLPLCLFCLWLRRRADETVTTPSKSKDGVPVAQVFREDAGTVLLASGLAIALFGVGYIGLTYLSVHLIQVLGYPPTQAYWVAVVAIFTSCGGAIIAGRVSDRIGLMTVARGAMLTFAVVSLPAFYMMTLGSILLVTIAFTTLMIVYVVASTPIVTGVPMLFRPKHRYTATALVWNVGAVVAGATTPLVSFWLVEVAGSSLAPVMLCVLWALIGVVCAALVRRRLVEIETGSSVPPPDRQA